VGFLHRGSALLDLVHGLGFNDTRLAREAKGSHYRRRTRIYYEFFRANQGVAQTGTDLLNLKAFVFYTSRGEFNRECSFLIYF
jgi:hypothetical protein